MSRTNRTGKLSTMALGAVLLAGIAGTTGCISLGDDDGMKDTYACACTQETRVVYVSPSPPPMQVTVAPRSNPTVVVTKSGTRTYR